jgi:HSP20 family protein
MAVTLMPAEPSAERGTVRTGLDCLYDEWLDGGTPAWTAAIDIVRRTRNLVARADLPGVKPDAIRIDLEDGILTISGDAAARAYGRDARYVRRERAGLFCRSVAVPAGVDAAQVKATTSDGVVEVTIPLSVPAIRESPARHDP